MMRRITPFKVVATQGRRRIRFVRSERSIVPEKQVDGDLLSSTTRKILKNEHILCCLINMHTFLLYIGTGPQKIACEYLISIICVLSSQLRKFYNIQEIQIQKSSLFKATCAE